MCFWIEFLQIRLVTFPPVTFILTSLCKEKEHAQHKKNTKYKTTIFTWFTSSTTLHPPSFVSIFINSSIKGLQWCNLSITIRFSLETRWVQWKFAFPNAQKGCSWLGSAWLVSIQMIPIYLRMSLRPTPWVSTWHEKTT